MYSAQFWILLVATSRWCLAAVLPTDDIHLLMNQEELGHIFGTRDVSQNDYELIYIRQHSRPKRFDPAELLTTGNPDVKRDSGDANHQIAHYSFQTRAGKDFQLKMRPNTLLVAPQMRTVVRDESSDRVIDTQSADQCHFIHIEKDLIAAVSHCDRTGLRGYIVENGQTWEIRPLSPRLVDLLRSRTNDIDQDGPIGSVQLSQVDEGSHLVGPHILKPARPLAKHRDHDCAAVHPDRQNLTDSRPIQLDKRKVAAKSAKTKPGKSVSHSGTENEIQGRMATAKSGRMILELGIFVDEALLKLFMPYFSGETSDREQQYIRVREVVLAFVNGMQALYNLPSLGQALDLSIVYMEFQAKQPAGLPAYEGERGALLDSFCSYQRKLNKASDSDAEHWDMALYLSGLDFFANEGGRRNFVTMGLSTVTGVCTNMYNCVIGEMGVVNQNGQPYPSTGFTSVYVMAHEIGHNLGMSHDSSDNSCPADGFIMSPSRGVVGETQWSSCSAKYLRSAKTDCLFDLPSGSFPNYNHDKYNNRPGQLWTADDQCRILLRDRNAYAYLPSPADLQESCNSMKCRTPNRDGYFNSGPALPGTVCGSGRWCQGGSCVPMSRDLAESQVTGGWSTWKEGQCTSGCLDKAKGVIVSSRTCDNPKPSSSLGRCQGEAMKITGCDDSAVCKSRISVQDYANKQCAIYGPLVPVVDPKGPGKQAPFSSSRPWQSCAVYCKLKDRQDFYTPRLELNNLPDISAFFPDGTWCGNDGSQDFYCMQRLCLPASQSLSRSNDNQDFEIDILNNAPLTADGQLNVPLAIQEYFTLDANGNPIKDNLDPNSLKEMEQQHETGLAVDDFVTIKP